MTEKSTKTLSKKKKILAISLSIVAVVLIVIIVLFVCLFSNFSKKTIPIIKEEKFDYPDFALVGQMTTDNPKELFLKCLSSSNESDWEYLGEMEGSCVCSGIKVFNEGTEKVKKQGENYLSTVETSSLCNSEILKNIWVNSAKREYLVDNTLYSGEIEKKELDTLTAIEWDNVSFEVVENEVEKDCLTNVIGFLATEENIEDEGKVFQVEDKKYISLKIDTQKLNPNYLMSVLQSKISAQSFDIGMTLLDLDNAEFDLSELEINIVAELENGLITGREFLIAGKITLKSWVTLEINVDMSMSAIINYDKDSYEFSPPNF